MKKLFSILAIMGVLNAYSQTEIKINEISSHIGDSIKVNIKIYGGKFLSQSNGKPTLLNAGAKYPDALLTLFIGLEVRNKFSTPPEEMFVDKEVTVTGKIILFKNKPEIIIYKLEQIVLIK